MTVVALVVPAAVATTGLLGFPIAVATVAAILLIFVVGYLAMARHIPNAGAFYAYVAHGLGRPLGVGTSWLALTVYTCFQLCCYGGFGALTAPLVTDFIGMNVPWYVMAFAAWALVGLLGANEVKIAAWVLVGLVVVETALVLLYSIAVVLGSGFSFNGAAVSLDNLWGPTAGVLVVLGATAFAGVEQSAVYIEESKDPRRTIPKATYVTIFTIAAVYFVGSWVQISGAGPTAVEKAAAEGGDLFFNQAAAVLGQAALHVGRVSLGAGLIAALVAFHQSIARYLFASGREGILFRLFGRTTIKGAPRYASLAQSGFALVVLIVYALAGWDPLVQLFYWGSTSGGLGVLLLYALTSIAVIGYFARDSRGENVWKRLIAPLASSVILIFLGWQAVDHLDLLYSVAPGTGPALIVPLGFLVVFAAGTCWGLILKYTRPQVYQDIGRGTRAATASASGLSAALI